MHSTPTLEERFRGSLLGLAVGDALGALFEGQSPGWLKARFPTRRDLLRYAPRQELCYTDDTQMAIGVAETLASHGEIIEEPLCAAFAANYVPDRGYGWGARLVLDAMREGRDYREVASTHFPGGSLGNGAAMRVAPVGMVFAHDHQRLWQQAHASALPTHLHPLGIEGAQLIALAVALVMQASELDRGAFFKTLQQHCTAEEYRSRLLRAEQIDRFEGLAGLGNGIQATESVVTAIGCFAVHPESYVDVVASAILLGGDTDTIAAMAGAISGAYLGIAAIPDLWLSSLEDSAKGRSYIDQLARSLCSLQRVAG